MAKCLKFYAVYTLPASPDLCHRTTLLNIDVPIFLPNTGFITTGLHAQIWLINIIECAI